MEYGIGVNRLMVEVHGVLSPFLVLEIDMRLVDRREESMGVDI